MNEIIKKIIDQPIISSTDVLYMIIASIAIYYLRAILDYLFLRPISLYFNVKDPIGMKKFMENAWYIVYYPTVLVLGYYILIDKPFFPWKENSFFPSAPYQDWIDYPEIKWYYFIQTGFYLQASVSMLWETKRNDFLIYCIHHAATISLLLFSYMAGQHRMGCNILFVHDISDVMLYLTKCLHYIDLYGGHKWADTIGRFTFILLTVSFFITRLFIYPIKIIWQGTWMPDRWQHSASMYFLRFEPGVNDNSLIVMNHDRVSIGGATLSPHYLLLILMFVLVILHAFWGYLLARMCVKFVMGDLSSDIRSDEDESLETDKIKGKKNKVPKGENGSKSKDKKNN